MRPISNSSSCNTLIDLNLENYKSISADGSEVHDIEFVKTELLLPQDNFVEESEDESPQYLVNMDDGDNHLYLPFSATGTPHVPIDVYLRGIPDIIESADNVLAQNPRVFKLDGKGIDSSEKKILNVLQGEMAHAVPEQCDVMVSDDATTCHIVALRSYRDLNNKCSDIFASLTHIDDAHYEKCIRQMFLTHQKYYKEGFMNGDSRIKLDIHVMGGFDDQDGTSREISESLISLFATIAKELKDMFKITIQTCAITSINDNGCCAPIGRGFGIELETGVVFLAEVENSISGPAVALRCARGWTANDGVHTPSLRIVHDVNKKHDGLIVVQPFKFEAFQDMDLLMNLPDDLMLQYTSTSPDVEKDNYCDNVRSTLRFLLNEKWRDYFGSKCDKPLVFRRSVKNVNEWQRI